MSIDIVDQTDSLVLTHFTECDMSSPKEIQIERGIIKEKELKNGEYKTIVKTFPFTPEILHNDEVNMNSLIKPLFENNTPMYPAEEGSIVRLYFYEDWKLSTHHKLDAYKSRWGTHLTFGELFEKEVLKHFTTMEDFYSSLDKELVYVFLIKTSSVNRMVCVRDTEESELLLCGVFSQHGEKFKYPDSVTLGGIKSMKCVNIDDILEDFKIRKSN